LTTEIRVSAADTPRVPSLFLSAPRRGTEWALVIDSRFQTWNPCSDVKDHDPDGLRRAPPWTTEANGPGSSGEENGRRQETGGKRPYYEAGYPVLEVYFCP